MRTRMLYTKIWEDDFITSIPLYQRGLFVYFLTNSRIGQTGIYEVSDRIIQFETGATKEQLDTAKEVFIKANKIIFTHGWIKVVNVDKYNAYTGDKNALAKEKELASVPEDILSTFDTLSIEYARGMDTPTNHNHNHNNNLNNNLNNNSNIYTSSINTARKSLNYLKNIPQEDIEDFTKTTTATQQQIIDKGDDLYNYCKAKGRKYSDYKSFLRNALKKDYAKKERGQFLADLVT